MENIRPIRTEDDYKWAIAEITRYFHNQPAIGSPGGDRFDVLATLIETYEDKHYPIADLDPVSSIEAHMELFSLSRSDLAEIIGSRSRASEIMNRKRSLTMGMAFRLNEQWRIPAEVLIRPYHLEVEQRPGKATEG